MSRSKIFDTKIRKIVAREREALAELIVELNYLDSIRGYIDLGFANMFEYLTKGLGYSNGSAQRRIDVARLAIDIPCLPNMLEKEAKSFGRGEARIARAGCASCRSRHPASRCGIF